MSETVKWAGLNKFKFGEVKLEGHTNDAGYDIQFGIGEAKNVKPKCKKGDTITCDFDENDSGYPIITNIKVVGKAQTQQKSDNNKSGGGNSGGYNNSPYQKPKTPEEQDQIMRQSAVKAAADFGTDNGDISVLLNNADTFFKYYKTGAIPPVDTLADEDN